MARHRLLEGRAALVTAGLGRRSCEQADSPMAVLDEVVDEQLDAGVVVEDDAAVAGVDDGAVEEDAGYAPARHLVELRAIEADRRDEQPVDPMGKERLQCLDLALGRLLAVHQQRAIPGVVQRRLCALERRGVEGARDVGDDEADRVGGRRAQGPGELRRLELEVAGRVGDCGARPVGQLAPPIQGTRSRRRRDAGSPRDVSEGDRTAPQTVAQAIATLS
jgi:hypothetical protein